MITGEPGVSEGGDADEFTWQMAFCKCGKDTYTTSGNQLGVSVNRANVPVLDRPSCYSSSIVSVS